MLRQIPEWLFRICVCARPAGVMHTSERGQSGMGSRSFPSTMEDHMKSAMTLAIGGLAFLAGCGEMGDTAAKAPAPAKPKDPYHIEFATAAAKPNPTGVTIPGINYTAVSKSLEKRAVLLVRLDNPSGANDQPALNQMIMGPVDMPD